MTKSTHALATILIDSKKVKFKPLRIKLLSYLILFHVKSRGLMDNLIAIIKEAWNI